MGMCRPYRSNCLSLESESRNQMTISLGQFGVLSILIITKQASIEIPIHMRGHRGIGTAG